MKFNGNVIHDFKLLHRKLLKIQRDQATPAKNFHYLKHLVLAVSKDKGSAVENRNVKTLLQYYRILIKGYGICNKNDVTKHNGKPNAKQLASLKKIKGNALVEYSNEYTNEERNYQKLDNQTIKSFAYRIDKGKVEPLIIFEKNGGSKVLAKGEKKLKADRVKRSKKK